MIVYSKPETLISEFASRGLVVLSPHDLDVPLELHASIYEQERAALRQRKYVTASLIPDILQVINSPGVVAACDTLVGKNWAVVPFTHNTPFMSGSNDQHWHKDDNGPYNGRKQRHHQAIQIEMLYYPQEVKADMGPTATVPYSQYWTFNHEENHDNFAGADHLDFAYQLTGMERIAVSGPRSNYRITDIANQDTAHDHRMRSAVEDLRWPMCHPFEVGPLVAGSVVLYSHNLLHRGNHRRDDWKTWRDNPRFMWRFWLYRTTDPLDDGIASSEESFDICAVDQLTHFDMKEANTSAKAVWRYHDHWLRTGRKPREARVESVETIAKELFDVIQTKHDRGEPARIGAAYQLASLPDLNVARRYLEQALFMDRENIRRAASYGLVALGEASTGVFVRAASSTLKWHRKAAAFGLGDAGELTGETLDVLKRLLLADSSVYVRSVAAGSIGSFARRAVANELAVQFLPICMRMILSSLSREDNRLAMDKAQGRSIKMVRPTDESDLCEGIGINYDQDRFEPVRSAVRENALNTAVILCSHGASTLGSSLAEAIHTLQEIVRSDTNVFSVGFALDALNRLANLGASRRQHNPIVDDLRDRLPDIYDWTPIHSLEPILRGGLSARDVARQFDVSDRMNLPFQNVAPQLADSAYER